MLAEKESLRRFLIVYIFSTLFLLGAGGYFYYQLTYNNIINNNILKIKNNIYHFIELNHEKHFLKTGIAPEYNDIPVAIYINKVYVTGNFKPDHMYFAKEYWIEKDRLYYMHQTHKKWGNMNFVSYMDISSEIQNLKEKLFYFFLFAVFFVVLFSIVLGRIFLKPMKESILLLEDFITDATHEINTPISNIVINIEMLQALHPELKENEELKKIIASSFRVSKIFKDLSFIKLNHASKKEKREISVDEVLKERISFFETNIHNKKLQIHTDLSPKKVFMDEEDLIRIIDNLLFNAIKYTPPQGTIEIKLSHSLEIINDGRIEKPEKMIQKFIRGEKDDGGFGLGLHIVKKITDLYGFEFSLQSSGQKVFSKISF